MPLKRRTASTDAENASGPGRLLLAACIKGDSRLDRAQCQTATAADYGNIEDKITVFITTAVTSCVLQG
jgi:hypothetical protein